MDVIIYLATDEHQLIKRTQKDKKRPLLKVPNPVVQIKQLLHERDPLYRALATRIVPTNHRGPKLVAKDIANDMLSLV